KERIDDSLGLLRNYNKLGMALNETLSPAPQIPVVQKIDDVIAIVDEYRLLIFREEGFTVDQWNSGQGHLKRPESAQVSSPALLTGREQSLDTRLEASLNSLIREIEGTAGYEELAKAALGIFDFTEPSDGQYSWTRKIFQYNTQSWSLIYLYGLETNLKMIRATMY
ncbi:MAG TPA: hypothetical protein VMV74_11305, partial [Bacteroidales bacterium]|nr:hypothetical protein [Bacteroidales bacterium]